MARSDGTDAVRVEVPAGLQARKPRWSPDGKFVYFGGAPDGPGKHRFQVFRVAVPDRLDPAARLPAEPLELDGADDMHPRLSRDGSRIYFTSNRSGGFQVWRAPAAGGAAEAMSPPDGTWLRPVAEETPDGGYLFYTSMKGIWRLSLRTGARELYLAVDALGVQVKANGIYYDTPYSVDAGEVLFQPFAPPHAAPRTFLLGVHRAWSTLPLEDGLLASLVRTESNIELYSAR